MKKNTEKIESLTRILEQIDFLLKQQDESENILNFTIEDMAGEALQNILKI